MGDGPRVGSDTGGTFTDLVDHTGRIAKVPSTPADPGAAVRAGLAALVGPDTRPGVLAHGTTVATNVLLERRGATTALVTTEGFADLVEIARQDRPDIYDSAVDRPTPLVPRARRLEVRERLDAQGSVLVPLDLATVPAPDPDVEALAVCLLHSDLDPRHERAVAAALRAAHPDVEVVGSHEVSPEMREYERTATTVADAYLRPVCRRHLDRLAEVTDTVLLLTSEGGLVPVGGAARSPARLLLSGPAGGVRAAAAVAVANGFPDALTFDMGGTSTDVCLVLGGQPDAAAERAVAGFPIRLPSLDVHTIGAGGGSIAGLDAGGALVVGPRSAGAVPGPACYARGGTEPTVTDADLVLGRIDPDATFPGIGRLDVEAARAALAGVGAEGVVRVVEAEMVRALRHVSVERGVDPRGLALVAFGGAGPLHACALAEQLGIETVLIPARAGVFSAVGVLCSPLQREVAHSWPTPLDHHGLDAMLEGLAAQAAGAIDTTLDDPDIEVEVALDCRYLGQSHELRVPTVDAFPSEHERRNGYRRDGTPIEVIALRAVARRPAPVAFADLPAPVRRSATGPVVVAEEDCTIWIPEGWRAEPGEAGALLLTRSGHAGERLVPPSPGVGEGVLDAAGLQVLVSRLEGIAEEMGDVLRRAAFSPNIKERADGSAAVFTPSGELLAQAAHIPVHLGSMPASVRAVIDAVGDAPARDASDGDAQYLVNDPFAGGTHLNDLTLVAPCWVDGELAGWVANRAHHADVGGAAPGSMPADATEIHQEGLRIPPTRFDAELRALVLANSRTPTERAGDLDAQVGANLLGLRRFAGAGRCSACRGGGVRGAADARSAGGGPRRDVEVRGRPRL